MIAAGELDQLVTIQARTMGAASVYGESDATFATVVADVAAKVRPMNVAEKLRNGFAETERAYAIRIRYIDANTPRESGRILWDGRTLDIRSAIPWELESMEIVAVELKEGPNP